MERTNSMFHRPLLCVVENPTVHGTDPYCAWWGPLLCMMGVPTACHGNHDCPYYNPKPDVLTPTPTPSPQPRLPPPRVHRLPHHNLDCHLPASTDSLTTTSTATHHAPQTSLPDSQPTRLPSPTNATLSTRNARQASLPDHGLLFSVELRTTPAGVVRRECSPA